MLEKLTLEEKIGQMFMFGINSSNTEGTIHPSLPSGHREPKQSMEKENTEINKKLIYHDRPHNPSR